MYLDIYNSYTSEIIAKYKLLCKTMKEMRSEWNTILDHFSDNEPDLSEYPEIIELIDQYKIVLNEIILLTPKYFAYYYPNRNAFTRWIT